MRSSVRRDGAGVGHASARPRVAPHPSDLAQQHQEAAERDAAVDEAHGQVDDGHALELHALQDQHREIGEQRQEDENDYVDRARSTRAGPGGSSSVSSTTAMWELRRVTMAAPMKVTHIRP